MKWWRMVTNFMACAWNIVSTLMLYFVNIRSVLPFYPHLNSVTYTFVNKSDRFMLSSLYHASGIWRPWLYHLVSHKFCKNLFSGKSVSGNTGPTASSEWLAMFENDAHRVRFMQLSVSLWSSCLKGSSPYKVAQFLDCRALCLPDKW